MTQELTQDMLTAFSLKIINVEDALTELASFKQVFELLPKYQFALLPYVRSHRDTFLANLTTPDPIHYDWTDLMIINFVASGDLDKSYLDLSRHIYQDAITQGLLVSNLDLERMVKHSREVDDNYQTAKQVDKLLETSSLQKLSSPFPATANRSGAYQFAEKAQAANIRYNLKLSQIKEQEAILGNKKSLNDIEDQRRDNEDKLVMSRIKSTGQDAFSKRHNTLTERAQIKAKKNHFPVEKQLADLKAQEQALQTMKQPVRQAILDYFVAHPEMLDYQPDYLVNFKYGSLKNLKESADGSKKPVSNGSIVFGKSPQDNDLTHFVQQFRTETPNPYSYDQGTWEQKIAVKMANEHQQ